MMSLVSQLICETYMAKKLRQKFCENFNFAMVTVEFPQVLLS